jgi:hypothetical protein
MKGSCPSPGITINRFADVKGKETLCAPSAAKPLIPCPFSPKAQGEKGDNGATAGGSIAPSNHGAIDDRRYNSGRSREINE